MSRARFSRAPFGAAVLLVVVACAATAPSVELGAGWPAKPATYDEAYERWTRHATSRKDWNTVIEAYATLKAPEWRSAYVDEYARRAKVGDADRAALAKTEQDAAADSWEVELVVATWKGEWNDFAKQERSMWRVSLVGDDGREVLPTAVKPDRRPDDVIESWFPGRKPFFHAYVVTFPKNAPDGKPLLSTGDKLTMRVGSAIGAVELVWSR